MPRVWRYRGPGNSQSETRTATQKGSAMCSKPDRVERRDEARRRLREQQAVRLTQTTRPRGNAPIDQRDLERHLERLEAVVGR
jgi:hypothetical protein